jgi:amicyanin
MNKNAKIAIFIAVIIIAVGGIALAGRKSKSPASSTSSASTTTATAGATATNAVSIKDFAFGPSNATVKVGDTVTWTNTDDVHHTITADTASADAPSSKEIGKGETYSFKFTKAGTYTYHCMPHPYMHGTVVVTN